MKYPDTPWGHLKRKRDERAGVPQDEGQPAIPESQTETVTKKKRSKKKK